MRPLIYILGAILAYKILTKPKNEDVVIVDADGSVSYLPGSPVVNPTRPFETSGRAPVTSPTTITFTPGQAPGKTPSQQG